MLPMALGVTPVHLEHLVIYVEIIHATNMTVKEQAMVTPTKL